MSVSGKEDVYESEDLPESEQFLAGFNARTNEEASDQENIELIHIDINAARKRFKDSTLNTRNIDFSDSIARRRGKSYGSTQYVLEVVGKEFAEPETAEQKYNRLACEIDELAQQLKDETVKPTLTVNETSLADLTDELKSVKVSKSSGAAVQPTGKEGAAPNVDKSSNAKLLSLEQRIRRIESLVGTYDPARQSIADAVEDIRFRLEALNPTYIEGMETKLNALISKLDQVEDKKQKSIDGEMESKVNDLLELMSKWDVACVAMPSNLKKLQGLHRLHEQAQHFSERLSQLVGVRDQIEKAIAADRMAICELQVKAKEDINAVLQQISSLEERLQKAKIQRLAQHYCAYNNPIYLEYCSVLLLNIVYVSPLAQASPLDPLRRFHIQVHGFIFLNEMRSVVGADIILETGDSRVEAGTAQKGAVGSVI
ncbi:unnamed protein product [Cylicocyclus nassatus]|uniref:Dynactin subunit 2 n=1 Tax=Cylicocyclus nassatus TaxID=53992 RepID=A0AA36M5E6_CYLNA|nr:unnamed protein product [Cylicocyclus nassatus]